MFVGWPRVNYTSCGIFLTSDPRIQELGLPPNGSPIPDEEALPRCNTLVQAIATEWMYLASPQYSKRVDAACQPYPGKLLIFVCLAGGYLIK